MQKPSPCISVLDEQPPLLFGPQQADPAPHPDGDQGGIRGGQGRRGPRFSRLLRAHPRVTHHTGAAAVPEADQGGRHSIPEFIVAAKFKFEFHSHSGFLFAGDVSVVAEGPAVRPEGVPRGGRLRGERQCRGEEQRRAGQGAKGNGGN